MWETKIDKTRKDSRKYHKWKNLSWFVEIQHICHEDRHCVFPHKTTLFIVVFFVMISQCHFFISMLYPETFNAPLQPSRISSSLVSNACDIPISWPAFACALPSARWPCCTVDKLICQG